MLVALPFRTSKEAIAIANNTLYGLAASVHSEQVIVDAVELQHYSFLTCKKMMCDSSCFPLFQMTLALETAKHLKAGTVWLNCHNMFDAAAGFGGYKQSGYGRDGGKEGLYEYARPRWQVPRIRTDVEVDLKKFGATYAADRPAINGNGGGEGENNGCPKVRVDSEGLIQENSEPV